MRNDMSKTSVINTKIDTINKLSTRYSEFKETIDINHLEELARLATSFKSDAANAQEQNRVLRIGIVGQINRGKSSFLNSLLFNGKDVLPKSATPMTAALTRICYSETPSASVEFYSKNEWNKVVEQAQKIERLELTYQQELAEFNAQQTKMIKPQRGVRPPQKPNHADEAEACAELYNMVKRSGLNVEEYLDQTQTISNSDSNEGLITDLNPYVGADGKYTPIVKSTELALNLPELKDIEVVDTPGMNDPIISRGRRTQEFLGQCDVIFLLSYCGQFLDMHDMGLLAQNIPNKGIDEIVLIGSIFDGALLDEYHNYETIQQALPAITQKLNTLATSNVDSVCRQDIQSSGGQSNLMQTLKNALPPIFISSRCYDLARKGNALSEDERHTLTRLNSMFKGFEFTQKILEAVANFKKVDSKLTEVRSNKESILSERFDNLLAGVQREILHKLESIQADTELKRKVLLEGDLAEMEKKQAELVKRIEAGKVKVSAVFEKYRIQAEKALSAVHHGIKNDAQSVKRVNSTSGSREEAYKTYREVSDSSWYNPFSWGSTRTVSSTNYRTVSYTYANVQDAVDKLEEFVISVGNELFTATTNAININKFKDEIKNAVKGLFDFSDTDFDPEMILLPLGNAVDRITIPAINLDLEHHITTIRQQFSANEVEGDEMTQLREEQSRVVQLLLKDIGVELDTCTTQIITKLTTEESNFIPDLTKDLHASVEQLKADLSNREAALELYDFILGKVIEDINLCN